MGEDRAARAPSAFGPTDERPHAGGPAPWAELWWFAAADHATAATVVTAYGVVPAERRAWYSTALFRPDRPLLFAADDEIGWGGSSMTVRRPSLWADHVCEAPFEQWTVANEAHAVALDDPLDALGDGRGTPAAMAFDLEWYASSSPEALVSAAVPEASLSAMSAPVAGYVQRGEVDGIVELAGGAITIVGSSCRVHAWGDLAALDATGALAGDAVVEPSAVIADDAGLVVARWPLPGGTAVAEQWFRRAGWRLALRRDAS